MKLTDEIAAAPFRFKEIRVRSFDFGTQRGFSVFFESVIDPEYTYSNAIRFMKPTLKNEESVTVYETAQAMEHLAHWLKNKFNEDGTLKPDAITKIRERENAQA